MHCRHRRSIELLKSGSELLARKRNFHELQNYSIHLPIYLIAILNHELTRLNVLVIEFCRIATVNIEIACIHVATPVIIEGHRLIIPNWRVNHPQRRKLSSNKLLTSVSWKDRVWRPITAGRRKRRARACITILVYIIYHGNQIADAFNSSCHCVITHQTL